MDSVPFSMMLSVIVVVAVVSVGRWFLVADTITDRLINRAWAWDLVGLVLYTAAARVGSAALGQRLFLCCGLMTAAVVVGVGQLVDGADPEAVRRSQKIYGVIAALIATLTLAISPVAQRVLRLDIDEFVWLLSEIPLAVSGFLIARASLRELRTAGHTVKEKLTYSVLFVLASYWTVSAFITVARAAYGTSPSNPGNIWAITAVLCLLLVTALTAIPLFSAVLTRVELDRFGWRCRRLRPLWRDLTTAVPEVVLRHSDAIDSSSASRLYRMTVEIQDALLRLKPYVPASIPGREGPPADDVSGYAHRIAHAVHARAEGHPVRQSAHVGAIVAPGGRDRAQELRQLLELAHEWPRARASIAARTGLYSG
ncbi:MAB_1171c family putative transporter [Nocardia sp. NPDC057440]|uniref:MAB_1171c family putative transporter n=1 Tax=Nocardia sp. NPDC057440 TaxID=3346134 RepID=UPI00366DBD61